MVGLIDIVPLVERVTVRGHEVEVHHMSIPQLGQMIFESSEFRRLAETNRLDLESMLTLSGPMIAKLIAACCPGSISEMSAANLSPGEQAELLVKIIKVNLPSGFGPFVELWEAAWARAAGPKAPASFTNSGTRSLNSERTAIPTQ